MLEGLDPILLIQLYKILPAANPTLAKIPLGSANKTRATIGVIPIYLSKETKLEIDSESKNIDIDTKMDGLSNGDPSAVNQSPLGSILSVSLKAQSDSDALNILLALSEQLLDKTISQEYEVTYMHKGFTVFGGLLHGLSLEMNESDDLYRIKLEISRGRPATKAITVEQDPNAVRLGTAGTVPPVGAPTLPADTVPSKSVITPKMGGLS